MPRVHVRVLHDLTCKGCGVVFQHHNRVRVFCSLECKLSHLWATGMQCTGCGAAPRKDIPMDEQVVMNMSGLMKLLEQDFIEEHQPCRRKEQDDAGRPTYCTCDFCQKEKGLPPVARLSRKRENAKPRSIEYQKHRTEVYERDRFICQICLIKVEPDAHPSSDTYPCLDHIDRQIEGGSDEPENLRTAHRWCNAKREGWFPLEEPEIMELARERFAHLIKDKAP